MAPDSTTARDDDFATKEDGPPPYGQPVPVEPGGPLPRVVQGQGKMPPGNYRAPDGCTRYKIRARAHADRGILYVVAKKRDQAGAEKCFLDATGLAGEHRKACEQAKAAEQPPPAPPELVTVELPD